MNTLIKIVLTLTLLLVLVGCAWGIFNPSTNFLVNAGFFAGAASIIGLVLLFTLIMKGVKIIWKKDEKLFTVLFFISLIPFIESCNYAKSNQQVLVSDDCGQNWKQISAGDAVPKGVGNWCYMRVVIPNYPMQGDASFITNLQGKVRVMSHIDYDYSINNGLAFIKEAKSLGKANVDPDGEDAIDPAQFESAENRVIDKRIRDEAKQMFLQEDIIDMEQAELEDRLLVACNKRLEPLGVKLNFITLTFDTDEQTRQAIDVSTAIKIYESKGLLEVGKSIMIARAGATKVTVENKKD